MLWTIDSLVKEDQSVDFWYRSPHRLRLHTAMKIVDALRNSVAGNPGIHVGFSERHIHLWIPTSEQHISLSAIHAIRDWLNRNYLYHEIPFEPSFDDLLGRWSA